ncbi:hypothetical protein V8J36_01890 [Frigidibacter sp. MR17.14]|uniref:hypothetical protein n=1 Tax=Frigidibacter sp. MR17.14 TaxID=3126509 RepID=UPI003012E31B
MQLLVQIETADPEGWKASFERDAENRGQAGLMLLQLWHATDSRGQIFALFEVHDRARAQAWLDKAEGFGRPMTAHFLRTA